MVIGDSTQKFVKKREFVMKTLSCRTIHVERMQALIVIHFTAHVHFVTDDRSLIPHSPKLIIHYPFAPTHHNPLLTPSALIIPDVFLVLGS